METLILLLLAASPPDDPAVEARRLVARLGSDRVEEREDADARLAELGASAKAALLDAAASADSEVSLRARGILDRLAPYEREVVAAVSHLLQHAMASFLGRRLDECLTFCDAALDIDPAYPVARQLRQDALQASRDPGHHAVAARRIEGWKRWADAEESSIPLAWGLRLPTRARWPFLAARLQQGVLSPEEDPCFVQVHRKLDEIKVDLAFENAPIEDVLAFLRESTGLNILLDASIRDRVEGERGITLKAKGIAVKGAILLSLAHLNLVYRVTPELVILITARNCRVK
jgi:hypothetical protein